MWMFCQRRNIALAKLLDCMDELIMVIDIEERIVGINKNAEKYFSQFREDPLRGQKISTILLTWEEKQIKHQGEGKGNASRVTFDHEHFFEVRVNPAKSAKDKVCGHLIVLRDITHQKDEEAFLVKKNRELNKLIKNREYLLGVVAHDLKSPIGSMRSLLALIVANNDLDLARHKQYNRVLLQTMDNLYKLTDSLLDWSRSQQGRCPPKPGNYCLMTMVQVAAEIVKPMAELKEIQIENRCMTRVFGYFDISTVSIVMRNLLANSVKFTPKGGIVTIDVEERDEWIDICVQDTGIGISPDIICSLEEGLIVSSAGTEYEGGTGLGLAVCKNLITLNRGTLIITSKVGEGTAVTFTLPKDKNYKRHDYTHIINT